jgi:predicted adenine nucleotide alpha hydrolase (AANH) superfamily ATPase
MSHNLTYLSAKLLEDVNSGLERGCHDNILALVEVRDNAAHLLNKDLYLGRRVLEIGTASLQNYLHLATEWFQLDLSAYNFFLMPLSFYHGFEAAEPVTRAAYPDQIKRLLAYLDNLEKLDNESEGTQRFAMCIETKFVRAKDASSVAFRWTDNLDAPALLVREEDFMKNLITYKQLTDSMKRRYSDFLINEQYHKIMKALQNNRKYCIERLLNPSSSTSLRQRFYNPNIIQEFDKHYKIRSKAPASSEPMPSTQASVTAG